MKNKSIYNVINDISLLLFMFMLVCVILQVVFRYVIKQPLMWSEELSKYIFILVTFLGACIAFNEGAHIKVTLLNQFFPDMNKFYINMFNDLLILTFLIITLISAFKLIGPTWNSFSSTMPWYRRGYMYLSLGIGVLLMILNLITTLIIKKIPKK